MNSTQAPAATTGAEPAAEVVARVAADQEARLAATASGCCVTSTSSPLQQTRLLDHLAAARGRRGGERLELVGSRRSTRIGAELAAGAVEHAELAARDPRRCRARERGQIRQPRAPRSSARLEMARAHAQSLERVVARERGGEARHRDHGDRQGREASSRTGSRRSRPGSRRDRSFTTGPRTRSSRSGWNRNTSPPIASPGPNGMRVRGRCPRHERSARAVREADERADQDDAASRALQSRGSCPASP